MAQGTCLPWVKISSFLCRFQKKIGHIVGWYPFGGWRSHLENSGSATASHVVTARILRMGMVLISQVCGCPQGGTPVPGSSLVSGFPRGDPSSRFFPRSLVPGLFSGGTPVPAGGGTLVLASGSTPERVGVPPSWDWGNPSWDWCTPPPPKRQNSRASTCYVAGGMPLAVTQEDFLVFM